MTIKRLLLLFTALCFLLALGLVLLQYTASVDSKITVPLSLENLPQDLIIVGPSPKEVEVTIHGQKMVVSAFLDRDHTCALDLSQAAAGLFTIPVDAPDLRFPENISITEIKPASFTLRIEPKLTKEVPVVVNLADNPAPGYKVTLTLASPSSMQIMGSEKTLAEIETLGTRPVYIEGAFEPFKKEVAVDLPSGVSVGSTGTSLVTAQINIEENVVTRRFESIPVEGRNTVFPVKISPPEISIDIRGPENEVARLSVGDDITVYVDLTDLSPGVYVRRAQIPLSGGITAVAWDPEVFTVTIGD